MTSIKTICPSSDILESNKPFEPSDFWITFSVPGVDCKTIGNSEPNGPAIHLSFAVSQSNEPEIKFGRLVSLTNKPPNEPWVPLSSIILSPKEICVESTIVVCPKTVKLPLTVKLLPVSSIASRTDAVNSFNASVPEPAMMLAMVSPEIYKLSK